MSPAATSVLIVEDEDSFIDALTLGLTREGFKVSVARDGAEALDYLLVPAADGSRKALPQLVLLDLKLPKIDGHEVLRRIRKDEWTRLLPVVILTSSVEPGDRLAGYRHGANSYVRKPVDFAEFAKAVVDLGQYWLILNESPPLPRV